MNKGAINLLSAETMNNFYLSLASDIESLVADNLQDNMRWVIRDNFGYQVALHQANQTRAEVLEDLAEYIETFHNVYYIKNLDVTAFCYTLRHGIIPDFTKGD